MTSPVPLTVSVACFDREVWIRVEGRGNFQGSGCIKQFVHAMIGRGYREFVIDLGACEHMDSTFMGTLTGISQSLREIGQGSLKTLNVSPRNVELLENLGLNNLFDVEPAGVVLRQPGGGDIPMLPLPTTGSGEEKEIILSAHMALAQANETNAERFRDVLEYLRGDSAAG